MEFIQKLFTVQNVKPVAAAAATGVAVWGASELAGRAVGSLDSSGKMGEYISKFDTKAKEITGFGEYKPTQADNDAIMASLARINQQDK